MKISAYIAAGLLALAAVQTSWAQDQPARPDHYKGEASATLEQAVANFSEYNTKLAAILAKDSLSPADMNDIHQLTYTLENALEKMREEMTDLAAELEEVHIASETVDTVTAKAKGNAYLETARKLVK